MNFQNQRILYFNKGIFQFKIRFAYLFSEKYRVRKELFEGRLGFREKSTQNVFRFEKLKLSVQLLIEYNLT